MGAAAWMDTQSGASLDSSTDRADGGMLGSTPSLGALGAISRFNPGPHPPVKESEDGHLRQMWIVKTDRAAVPEVRLACEQEAKAMTNPISEAARRAAERARRGIQMKTRGATTFELTPDIQSLLIIEQAMEWLADELEKEAKE